MKKKRQVKTKEKKSKTIKKEFVFVMPPKCNYFGN